jgi:glycosyltransferase involved in cell wall biosynthesis
MKRFLFISSNIHAPWGGSELLWYKTAVFLIEKRTEADVAVIARKWPTLPHHVREIRDAGGHIFDLPVSPTTPFEYAKAKIWKPIDEQKSSLIRKFSPHLIVHSMGKSFEGGDWMKIAHELSVPYVNIIHLASELQWPSDDDVDMYRSGYDKAHCNYFVSEANKAIVCRQLGMEIANSTIVRNPISVSRKILPYPETGEGYHIALPALLVPIHKGQDIIFEVLSQKKWKQRPLHLNLYGTGDYSKSLSYYSRYLGLENVHFEGYEKNIEAVWRKNHLLIMSSRMEGLPLTLIEAMSCGRPAIVTGVAGMKECVLDGKTGFIARSAHPEFLDEAMEKAWNCREHWPKMGLLAAEWVKERIPFEPVEEFARTLLMQI